MVFVEWVGYQPAGWVRLLLRVVDTGVMLKTSRKHPGTRNKDFTIHGIFYGGNNRLPAVNWKPPRLLWEPSKLPGAAGTLLLLQD